jgi:IclR family pca regulon transcriptional regulator
MARRDTSPDFIEALARGLDVIRAFQPRQPAMSLAAVAGATGLARPTARRILLTLEQMGYVRAVEGGFELTPRVLELGMSYVLSRNLWEVARPHMERLVARTHESSSIAQLDGSDIVYVARVAVPKIVALAVTIGTRFPAMQTSLGKVLLAALPAEEAQRVLAEPSRSGIPPRIAFSSEERVASLREVRARGWALTDEERGRPGDRLAEREHARRRDPGRGADRGVPAAAAPDRRGDQRRLGHLPGGAADHRPAARRRAARPAVPGPAVTPTLTLDLHGIHTAPCRTTVRQADKRTCSPP